VASGAFNGLNNIVKQRYVKTSIGFGADVKQSSEEKSDSHYLDRAEPDDLVSFGMIPEFVGRLPVIVNVNELDEEALIRVIREPKSSILKQYTKLFDMDDVKLTFDDDALHLIAKQAREKKTGARGLRSIFERVLLDAMFHAPEENVKSVHITSEVIDGLKEPIYNACASDEDDTSISESALLDDDDKEDKDVEAKDELEEEV